MVVGKSDKPKAPKKGLIITYIMLGIITFFAPTVLAKIATSDSRSTLNELEDSSNIASVGLVLGAGVLPSGEPTEYLKNRLDTAVELHRQGKIKKMLLSGDNRERNYNEPQNMRFYALEKGIPDGDIVLDFAGLNTYDSCYRAQYIFGLSEVTVITQGYHLPRAVFTCQSLGIKTTGVAAVNQGRDFTAMYIIREHASTLKAFWEVGFKPPATILGEKEPIKL